MIIYGAKVGTAIAWDRGIIWTDGITTKSAERLIAAPVTELTAAEGGGSRYAEPGEAAYVRAALQAAGYLVVDLPSEEPERAKDQDDHYYGAWSGGSKAEGGHAEGAGGAASGTAARPGPTLDETSAWVETGPDTGIWAEHGTIIGTVGGDALVFTPDTRGAMKAKVATEVGKRIDAQMTEEEILATSLGDQIIQNYGRDGVSPGATVANKMHDLWAQTSGDSAAEAIALQNAAAVEFGLEGVANPSAAYGYTTLDLGKKWEESHPLLRAYARAEYENTQAMFAAAGVKTVTLYRGVGESIAAGADWTGSRTRGFQTNPLSSWSSSPFIATSFAADHRGPAYVLSIRVPVSRIFSTAISGAGCLPEYEAILLGGLGDEASIWRYV